MAFRVIGNYISPYVRKVLVCLELKGLDYEIDPIAPFVGNEGSPDQPACGGFRCWSMASWCSATPR